MHVGLGSDWLIENMETDYACFILIESALITHAQLLPKMNWFYTLEYPKLMHDNWISDITKMLFKLG